jgi:hypothetical protein
MGGGWHFDCYGVWGRMGCPSSGGVVGVMQWWGGYFERYRETCGLFAAPDIEASVSPAPDRVPRQVAETRRDETTSVFCCMQQFL